MINFFIKSAVYEAINFLVFRSFSSCYLAFLYLFFTKYVSARQ